MMQSLLGTSLGVFIGLTVIIIGGAAIMTGRALADGWKPAWQVVAACFGLALADRFLVYALFGGELLSLSGFIIDFVVITALALIAHRLTLVHKMIAQYPWRYERAVALDLPGEVRSVGARARRDREQIWPCAQSPRRDWSFRHRSVSHRIDGRARGERPMRSMVDLLIVLL